ncbi:MAG: GTPase Der [candidate division TM6 bacterium GW2011_GWE2_41_16]|nr:MAG: GTPase Der [candidate division TM6 bacterium GW2011_GWE2_41_16]
MKKKYARIAIVGRVNVGKSTLFNRISSDVKSIVLDYAGVTRDPIISTVTWKDHTFELADTAGLWAGALKKQDALAQRIEKRAKEVVAESDIVLFLVDGAVGITQDDRFIAKELHKLGCDVIIVVNKADNPLIEEHMHEFDALGFNKIVPVSAYHGTGVYELFDLLVSLLPVTTPEQPEESAIPRVVFIGRPNVGKSSLLNAIFNEEKAIVSEVAGTTRDSLAHQISFYQQHVLLIDTPGIRRKRGVDEHLEKLMVHSSLQALKDSDIVVLLVDVTAADIVDQELKLAFYAFEERAKGLIIVFNKVDIVTEQARLDLAVIMERYKHLLDKVPQINLSAKTGKNVGKLLPMIFDLWQRYSQQLDQANLHATCMHELARRPLFRLGEALEVRKVSQVRTKPPMIELEVFEPQLFGRTQFGFFENVLRAKYDLLGVPLVFVVKKR